MIASPVQIDPRPPQTIRLAEAGRDGPVRFSTGDGQTIDLSAFYQGQSCFITASGPSLRGMDLAALRNVVTWGTNNSWSVIRPRLWTCVDPAEKFHPYGWMDPSITKLVPVALANQQIRYRADDGQWKLSRCRVRDMPAVLFWQRGGRFEPADYLTENCVTWGNDEGVTCPCGIKGIRSVFMAVLKLAYSVGFRTVYLCGTDFRMEEGKPGYAFEQRRDRHAVSHNNRLYAAVNKRCEALLPYFEMAEFNVVNCTPDSGLKVFPYMPLADAIKEATKSYGAPMQTSGFYEPKPVARDEWGRRVDGRAG